MRVNENDIRKALIKDYIKRNWQNFAVAIFITIFLSTIIIYMSKGSMPSSSYGNVINLTKSAGDSFLEVKLDSGKIVKVPISDKIKYQKGKRVKLKLIQNDILQVKGYRFEEYL